MTLKRKIYLFLEYYLVKVFSSFYHKKTDDILIVRLDAIGDYLLFRNFLYELRESPEYNTKKITLIGNKCYREIAENFDSSVVDSFIWVDNQQIWMNKLQRILKLIELTRVKYDTIILPTYSRDVENDSIVNLLIAKNKVASIGDPNAPGRDYVTDQYYTSLLPATTSSGLFEFERNKEFFTHLLNRGLTTKLDLVAVDTKFHNMYSNYVVIFIGASASFRRWGVSKFIALAKWIHQEFSLKIVFCGGPNDFIPVDQIKDLEYCYNLVGQTNLVELIDLLSTAKFVVSNETSIPHMCVALKTPVFVVANVNYFGRFTPYPKTITTKYYPVYPPEVNNNILETSKLSDKYRDGSGLDINEIELSVVQQKIMENIIE